MLSGIQKLLSDKAVLLDKLEHVDKNLRNYSASISFHPFIKWNEPNGANDEDAFVSLLVCWLNIQHEYSPGKENETKRRASLERLVKLFGTEDFSQLAVKEIADKCLYQSMESCLIDDHGDERRRVREIKSLKRATGVIIELRTGEVLYFVKTPDFYSLISSVYMQEQTVPVYKSIEEILFAGERCESIRKRPGMYIGSMDWCGHYRLLFGIIEDLLADAKEKTLVVKLMPQGTVEVACDSYSVKNNTNYLNHLTIANALGEFFDYQDDHQSLRTEKGIPIAADGRNTVEKGIKIVWKADCAIFDCAEWNYFIVMNRMMELAALYPYRIFLSDGKNHNEIEIPMGLESFLCRKCSLFSAGNILSIAVTDPLFTCNVALSFTAPAADIRKSYVNGHESEEGGTHVEGVLSGAKKALRQILVPFGNPLTAEQLIKYMNYAVHIQLENPRWCGNTRRRLKNIEVKQVIRRQVELQLYQFLKQDIQPIKSIYPGLF